MTSPVCVDPAGCSVEYPGKNDTIDVLIEVHGMSDVEDGYGTPVLVVAEYSPELENLGVNPVTVGLMLASNHDDPDCEEYDTPADPATIPEGGALVAAGVEMLGTVLVDEAQRVMGSTLDSIAASTVSPGNVEDLGFAHWLLETAAILRQGKDPATERIGGLP